MANFILYVKNKGGSDDSAQKAVTLLNTYLTPIIKQTKKFSAAEALLVDSDETPPLTSTDVVVYLVKNIYRSIIAKRGGDISMASSNEMVLGLTHINMKICEVYFDRLYYGSPMELAGACYHEMAHIKSNLGNSMHAKKNGFLVESPFYNGRPTEENEKFLAKHIGRQVKMNAGY